jgi:hypothetical protein
MNRVELEIREDLVRYLARDIDLGAFREAFSPNAWDIENRSDAATVDLVREIDLALAEFDHGHWTEDELRARLVPYVTSYRVTLADVSVTGSSSSVVTSISGQPPGQAQYSSVDIRSVVAYAS